MVVLVMRYLILRSQDIWSEIRTFWAGDSRWAYDSHDNIDGSWRTVKSLRIPYIQMNHTILSLRVFCDETLITEPLGSFQTPAPEGLETLA